jgi:pyridoxamine 5'-phosphate oxidase
MGMSETRPEVAAAIGPPMDEAPELPPMRVSYERGALDEAALAATWHAQLAAWLDEAGRAGLAEPNAFVLATADARGRPSSRTVLCKGLDARGVVFYTNYTSEKSHQLETTHWASATFPWLQVQRQVTAAGRVEQVSTAETARYWASRPRGSQLGAWASPQSAQVPGRGALDGALARAERRFAGAAQVPVPPHWGGWRIVPELVEFWQGRADRMHDRLRYRLGRDGWAVQRLAP